MSTVVAVMDRDSFAANTDVLVVAEPNRQRLLWVPRDLWCDELGDRINAAYAAGGPSRLLAALAEHEVEAEHCVCLRRSATEAGLEGVTVTMPVRRRLEFWFQLEPQRPIEEGRKRIAFEPPVERLSGERIHQWLTARFEIGGPGGDLRRIERQQELVAVLLGEGFDFTRFIAPGLAVDVSDPRALEELSAVRWDWSFETLSGLAPVEVDGKAVLIRLPPPPR